MDTIEMIRMETTYHFNTNYGKIQRWLRKQTPGTFFTASTCAKQMNLTGQTVGNFLKWHEKNFEKAGKMKNGGTQLWVILSTELHDG
jgi:hypothetical protein